MFELISYAFLVPDPGDLVISGSSVDKFNPGQGGLRRSMNRAGILLASCAQLLPGETQTAIKSAAERVALYGIADYCTTSQAEILRYLDDDNWKNWSRWMPPKWGLQSSVGLVANSFSIVLGIEGGVHTFLHTQLACTQALAQASLDLSSRCVDIAVVAGVSSLEDPLTAQKYADSTAAQLSEGVGLLVLARGSSEIMLSTVEENESNRHYGIAHGLIDFLAGKGDRAD